MKLIVLVSGLFLNTQPTKKTETTGPIILILICDCHHRHNHRYCYSRVQTVCLNVVDSKSISMIILR